MSAVAGVLSLASTPAVASALLLLLVRAVPGKSAVAGVPSVALTPAIASALLLLLIRDVPCMSAVAGTLSVTNLLLTTTSRQGTLSTNRQRMNFFSNSRRFCPALLFSELQR